MTLVEEDIKALHGLPLQGGATLEYLTGMGQAGNASRWVIKTRKGNDLPKIIVQGKKCLPYILEEIEARGYGWYFISPEYCHLGEPMHLYSIQLQPWHKDPGRFGGETAFECTLSGLSAIKRKG